MKAITQSEYHARAAHEYAGPGTPCKPDADGVWVMGMDTDGATVLYTGVTLLDERDSEILERRRAKLDEVDGPRDGDYVVFADGVTRRVSFVTPLEWLPECDSVQTSDGGSWYLGDGYTNFSGGLYTGVPRGSLELTEEKRLGSCWFFHHDYAGAGRGVDVELPFRVYRCSEVATR